MSARRQGGRLGSAARAALGVLAVGALVASALLAPRLAGALGDYVSARAACGACARQIEAARAATDAGALAREAEAARAALAEAAAAYLTVSERDEALARVDAAARDAGIALHWKPLGAAIGDAGWPCAAHRYLLVAHGEFGALLDYAAGVAEDAPRAFALSDLHVGPDPSAATDGRSTLQITLTAYTLAGVGEPAPDSPHDAPRAVQGSAQAGQE